MKPLPETPLLLQVARRVVWFKEPHEALKDTFHFLAHVMTFGTVEDVVAVRDAVGLEGFRETIEHAPPGVFDPRSWAYWNLICGLKPALPMPGRERLFLA